MVHDAGATDGVVLHSPELRVGVQDDDAWVQPEHLLQRVEERGHVGAGVGVDVNPIAHTYTPEDREFIAHARTDVPALLDALEKVLELHQPVTDGMGFTEDGYGGISPACSSCGTSDEYAVCGVPPR